LYALTEKKILDTKLCDKIRATIFCFDGREDSSFEDILSWMPLLKNISSEIQLLICDSCDVPLRKKILEWSIENEFELIELNPSEESEDENNTIFSKSRGYGRVTEALQSHMWSNLVMKKDTKDQNDGIKKESGDLSNSTSPSAGQNSNDTDRSIVVDDADRRMAVDDEEVILEDQWIQNVFAEEDPDEESFEALFAKFASLKERASHLYGEDRKKYAEKVAIAFWKAMGGEEDEIAGLDDE